LKTLVTGGAGFIASHVCDRLLALGHHVAIVDNLVTGKRENLPEEAAFHETDICDQDLYDVFRAEQPEVVVLESIANPYYQICHAVANPGKGRDLIGEVISSAEKSGN